MAMQRYEISLQMLNNRQTGDIFVNTRCEFSYLQAAICNIIFIIINTNEIAKFDFYELNKRRIFNC